MTLARRFTLPALLVVLALAQACSDNATAPPTGLVRGQVTRIYSDQVVADARVEVGGEMASTDSQGRFLIKEVAQGEATIRVSADTYQDLVRVITVAEYQSVALELVPQDTLIAISGVVTHRLDGPQRVRLDHAFGSVWTDGDGRWSLDDAPLGPLTLTVEHPPYNPYATEVLVHSDGQEFIQTLTRDTTVTWWVEHDSYIFTRDDSLNANRGSRPKLMVTEDLGRTALFSLTPPALGYTWAELLEARLELHGDRGMVDENDLGEAQDLEVFFIGLDGPFFEGAVDFAVRPGFYPYGTGTLTLAAEPRNQPLVLDILPVIQHTPVSFWATGFGIATSVEQAPIFLLSSEYGAGLPEILDRPLATYRLRI